MSLAVMTVGFHRPAVGVGDTDRRLAVFARATDPAFLYEIGWDLGTQILAVPSGHPLLGWRQCLVENCLTFAYQSTGICRGCTLRMRAAGVSQEEFLAATVKSWRSVGVQACAVRDCPRPWKTKRAMLCFAHDYQREKLRLGLVEFLADPSVAALPSLGLCQVASCHREQSNTPVPYCQAHRQQLRMARDTDPGLDEQRWRRTAPGVAERGEISMRGLPALVVSQVLYGLQQRTANGTKTVVTSLRRVCDLLRAEQVSSIEDATIITLPAQRTILDQLTVHCRRLLLDPEQERLKDVWDAAAFGQNGTLTFTRISQRWLREAAKRWVLDDLPRRRGGQIIGTTQEHILALAMLSESLRAARPHDRGEDLAAVGRHDIMMFLNRLAHLEHRGTITYRRRITICRNVHKMLSRMRALTLTRPGEPLAGLPSDFTMSPQDLPPMPERAEPHRDLPLDVMRQLCAALPAIEDGSAREIRVAIELAIDTGRRPDEICTLSWDCLEQDANDDPVLVYDNHKRHRQGRRLPIGTATAELITQQKKAVRDRFPDAPLSELKLLPSPVCNPHGQRPISDSGLGGRHRAWLDRLPPLHLADGTEFDKSRVFLYAYRHTYAQRHADAGIPADVLRELMDHKSMDVTKGYYRVGEQRRRQAVDQVTAVQFDRHGQRIWTQAKTVLDAEHVRRVIGEVAVPFGVCAEPSNVSAGGHACPFRFRCVGCDHFRTDVSYLPDLHTYLDDLLRNRERVLAASDIDDWARTETLPSEEEISRVRRLINRVTTELDDLTPHERDHINEAVAVVRRHRTVNLGLPHVRQPIPDLRPERSA
jgi:integrase